MKAHGGPFRMALPLPAFVLHPLTALVIAAVHIYLAVTHLAELTAGNVEWTHIWKGFGALAGAYVFAALASRGMSSRASTMLPGTADARQVLSRLPRKLNSDRAIS